MPKTWAKLWLSATITMEGELTDEREIMYISSVATSDPNPVSSVRKSQDGGAPARRTKKKMTLAKELARSLELSQRLTEAQAKIAAKKAESAVNAKRPDSECQNRRTTG